MAGNYVLLETISLTQSAASVTFDNIPQSGYTDLKIVYSAQGTVGDQALYFYFNGSNANLSMKELFGNGSSAASQGLSNGFWGGITGATTGVGGTYSFANGEVYIPNYLSTNAKSISSEWVQEANAATAYSGLHAGLWNPGTQAAITSITIYPGSNNISANSTFSLYGVAATGTTPVTAPKATGGNIVANDGTYWYHAFLSSGNFAPQTSLTCDYLVVAGGGGGGGNGNDRGSGGGGAGGYRTQTSQSLTTQNYAVIIGGGGAAGPASGPGSKGADSSFNSTSSTGGGYGTNAGATGGPGGSGGGSSNGGGSGTTTGGSGNQGGYTPVEGYAGGNSILNNDGYNGAGGGGAGGAGANASAYNSSDTAGGIGVAPGSTWASATTTGVSGYYAAGGVGAGATRTGARSNAVAGTGNGGAGNSQGYTPGAGGSGIVIIRYAMV